jgi:hypothetical protein
VSRLKKGLYFFNRLSFRYNNYFLELDELPGIGADISPVFLEGAEKLII